MLLWVNSHFVCRHNGFYDMHFISALTASVSAVFLCEIAASSLCRVVLLRERQLKRQLVTQLAGLGQLTSCRITKHPIGTSILSHVLPDQTHSYCNSMNLDVQAQLSWFVHFYKTLKWLNAQQRLQLDCKYSVFMGRRCPTSFYELKIIVLAVVQLGSIVLHVMVYTVPDL